MLTSVGYGVRSSPRWQWIVAMYLAREAYIVCRGLIGVSGHPYLRTRPMPATVTPPQHLYLLLIANTTTTTTLGVAWHIW